jgi:hypothetical protein
MLNANFIGTSRNLAGPAPAIFMLRMLRYIPLCFQWVSHVSVSPAQHDRNMSKPLAFMDPAAGLELLAKPISASLTPPEVERQEELRRYWGFMFQQQLEWQSGNPFALAMAVEACSMLGKSPPPWIGSAIFQFISQHAPALAKRPLADFERDRARWQAVKLLRVRMVGGKRPLSWEKCFPAAAELLAGTAAGGISGDTIKKSYGLVQAAGGEGMTLKTYKAARAELARRRRRRKK